MIRSFLNPRFLLPLMIFMGVVVMGIRLGDIWETLHSGHISSPQAFAETKNQAPAPAALSTPDPVEKADVAPVKNSAPAMDRPMLMPGQDTDVSPAELKLLEQLSQRRDQLDARTKDLDTREALIRITETRVDQKIKEMDKLRGQLQAMVDRLGEAQNAQIENLVKIYETMKPEEAARIFETLDMPVLLGVIQKMKPARTAPIMAKMAPEKAKELTVALTKQDQLPQVK